MVKLILIFNIILCFFGGLSAQKNETYLVPAGKKVEDCIPFEVRFRFPSFITGKVFFTQGTSTVAKLNFDFLTREMNYIQGKDTLSISNPADIKQIIIDGTVFIMNNGYMELISNGKIPVGVKQYFNLMDERKTDPYGQASAGGAISSYSSLHTDGHYYKLTVAHDRLFRKVSEYFLATSSGGFVPFTKKKVLRIFPNKTKEIENYLESNLVDFESKDDLIKFAEYLGDI